MSVRPRGNTWQADFSFRGARIRKDGFESKLVAEQWERAERTRLENDQTSGTETAATSDRCDTLKALYDQTYERHWRGNKSERSAVINSEIVLKLLGKNRHPSTINSLAVDSLVAELKRQGNAGGTINRKLAALSKMLHHAHSRGIINSVPHIERQREAEHRIRWLSAEEEKRVLTWLMNTSRGAMCDLVVVLMDTGLRLSEALRLEWKDVDGGWIRVWVSKSATGRSVPQTSRVRGVFEKRKRAQSADVGIVFHDIDLWSAEYQWRALREALGFTDDPHFVMHMLRHTFCSRLAQRGVQIQTIQQLAGHKTITMTMRYSHLCPSNLQAAIEVLQPA